jgi:hypothetical protein
MVNSKISFASMQFSSRAQIAGIINTDFHTLLKRESYPEPSGRFISTNIIYIRYAVNYFFSLVRLLKIQHFL